MAKKGGQKGKPMVVSKVKRANHMKQKKGRPGGKAPATDPSKLKHKIYKHTSKTAPSPKGKVRPKPEAKADETFSGRKKPPKKSPARKRAAERPGDEFDAEEMMEMMEDEDLAHLVGRGSKKRRDDDLEEEYDRERQLLNEDKKVMRPLLPIKTRGGVVEEREVEVEEEEEEEEEPAEEEAEVEPAAPQEEEPVSVAEVYARRRRKLDELRVELGSLASQVMENAEGDAGWEGVAAIFKLYDSLGPDTTITGVKLISQTLVELFKDLAPGFEIKQTAQAGDRLKKTTRQVYGLEGKLLKYYQMFLAKLEKMFAPLKEGGRRDKKPVDEAKRRVGLFALKCMAQLLVAMPHFNYAKNMVHALIPFTAHKDDGVRESVCGAFRQLFREDKKGQISLDAVRQVNHLMKNKRHHQIPSEALDILLALRVKDVNLDREEQEEVERYKTLTRKEKLLIMSKNERRRRKKIERLEREIVAAKAEQNKESKTKFQTETVKLVFAIYFRILKMAPKSTLMAAVLRGLAKFAHTINIDFFADLVEVLNGLIRSEQLETSQCLHAVQVVLIMLSGQGEALNIDPLYFYAHLYRALLQLRADSPSHDDVAVALDCLDAMLIKRRKKVSVHRVLAFAKRTATCALAVHHNGALGLLAHLRQLFMTHKQTDVLLDLESTSASGAFRAELDEPEHCNAASTALWELHALARHYHPTVAAVARHLIAKCPDSGHHQLGLELVRKSPLELHAEYDPTTLAFKPAVAAPSNAPPNYKTMVDAGLRDDDLRRQVDQLDVSHVWDDESVDRFYAALSKL